jgi:hypothetical protein
MKSTKVRATNEQEPEILDATTLAAIDKSERWEPDNPGISFDEALKRARARHHAWQTAQLDKTA